MILIMIKTCLFLAFAVLAVYHVVVTNGARLYPTPANLLLIYLGLGFVGTVALADLTQYGDQIRTAGTLIGLAGIVGGGMVANLLTGFRPSSELLAFQQRHTIIDATGPKAWLVLAPVAIVSIIVGIVYLRAMGVNIPLELLRAYIQSGDIESSKSIYGALRTSVWRDTSRYIAPGYSAQFIKVLLPVVCYIWYFRGSLTRRSGHLAMAVSCGAVAFYFLAATGIRSYVIVFGAVFVVLASSRYGPFGGSVKSGSRIAWAVLIAVGAVFGLLTFLGGRTDAKGSAVGNVIAVAWDLVDRIAIVTADAQLRIMRVIASEPHAWGANWLDSFAILLPGSLQGRSTKLYSLVYGGHGNAPADLWTSLWIEFGWVGLVLVPPVIGVSLQWIHIRLVRGPKVLTRVVIFTMLSFSLIIISEPVDLLNKGVLTLFVLHGLLIASTLLFARREILTSHQRERVSTGV